MQVGMLVELTARGIVADRVYGASVGAVNGAAYASDPTPEGVAHLEEVWRGLSGNDVFPRGRMDGPWMYFQQRASVHPNTGLRRIVEEGIAYERLEDAALPVEVVATSLTDGAERWITSGPAVDAILASAAIPAIFPAVVVDGDTLVDGGVVNNVPISRAIEGGATRIYVLLCGPLRYKPPETHRPVEAVVTAFFVAIHARFVRELSQLPPGIEVIVFSGGGEPSNAYRDFSGTAELIEQGRAEVAAVLDRYRGTPQDVLAHTPVVVGPAAVATEGEPGVPPATGLVPVDGDGASVGDDEVVPSGR
jgi:NTE family protein